MEIEKQAIKILVVDDEETLREICMDALREDGYQVLQAEDGLKALDVISENEVDLVLSDLRMPEMDGMELLKSIKEKELDIDFLVMSGFATIETAVECIKLGAADYLPKPFNINHLLVKVGKVVLDRAAMLERKRLSSIVRLLNLSNAINSQLDLKSVCQEFALQVQENFSPDSVVLFLDDEDNAGLHKAVVQGSLFNKDHDFMASTHKLAAKAMEKRVSYLLDQNQDCSMPVFAGGKSPFFMMLAPLFSRMNRVGAVALARMQGPAFSRDDLQLLSVFAAHVAPAVQNARIYSRIKDQNIDIIRSYAKAVEAKDYYTKGHSDRVALYAVKLGRHLGLETQELEALYTAGMLHDIGKIGVPDHILNKPSRLNHEEYELMKAHPAIARDILAQVWAFKNILPIVYHHHERMDGKGYPDGIIGERIPALARIISVVDAFEAMTSDRAYRNALSWETAVKILKEGAGTQWDLNLVEEWVKLVYARGFENIQKDTEMGPVGSKSGPWPDDSSSHG